MKRFVLSMEDGSTSAVVVNDLSTVRVVTLAPPNASEGGSLPVMVDDQTFSLKGVTAVALEDDAPMVELVVEPEAVEPEAEPVAEPDVEPVAAEVPKRRGKAD